MLLYIFLPEYVVMITINENDAHLSTQGVTVS